MKKQYTKPAMKVCRRSCRTALLSGSDYNYDDDDNYYYSGPGIHYEQGNSVQF